MHDSKKVVKDELQCGIHKSLMIYLFFSFIMRLEYFVTFWAWKMSLLLTIERLRQQRANEELVEILKLPSSRTFERFFCHD